MICSEKELGLSDDHSGVLILEPDAPLGAPLRDLLGDVVLDVEITPNMARCMSMLGVAREVAALTGGRVRLPEAPLRRGGPAIDGLVAVEIGDPALCARYTATLLTGMRIGPSPAWLQRRLKLAGVRPINNVVDVTNYVMLEWGQPLHAFDYDALVRRAEGIPRIVVRSARPGESLVTLDGVTRPLTPERLLITDAAGPIAVAGVMGGAETEVTAGTTSVLLESASFHFVSIRRTTQALKLPSEASARFGRGVPPAIAAPASLRATGLMQALAGGEAAPGMADCYPAPQDAATVTLSVGDVRRILGVDLPREEIRRILTGLEFACEPVGESALTVTAPLHRLDVGTGVVGVADLAEELARVIGYDRLPVTELADALPPQRDNRVVDLEERVRDLLALAGLQEIITYRLTTPEREAELAPGEHARPAEAYVRLANPISAERVVLRRTLLPGLLEVMAQNSRLRDRLAFFEIGPVFLPTTPGALPDEPRRLALGVAGRLAPASWEDPEPAPADFFVLKGAVEALLRGLHLPEVRFEPASHPATHPGRTARLLVGGEAVGFLGQIRPEVQAAFDLDGPAVYAAELDLERILRGVSLTFPVAAVPRFPPVLQDLALVVDDGVRADELAGLIREAGGALLSAVRLFDVYRGPQVPEGKKSLAFSLAFQAADRTLTEADVEAEKRRILTTVAARFGAQLRA
jgi:phenylalanyl-tRNA synthetase beta chain